MAQKGEKVRLQTDDWNSLFPGQDFKIGNTIINIKPLSISSIAYIANRLMAIGTSLDTLNTTVAELDSALEMPSAGTTSAVANIVTVILDQAPDILSEMSGLHPDDCKELPLAVAVELFVKCMDVNITSQEDLGKNLKSLGQKFGQFLNPTDEEPVPAIKPRAPRLAS